VSDIGNKEIFSKNLKRYIDKKGVTQKDVAQYVGVNPSSVNDWIKCKKYPRIDKIEMLAKYFGILKSDLIEEKGINKNLPQPQMLTEGESTLVNLFRQVPADKQQTVLEMIRVALQMKE
jgi:transcriptional regulator with XRE-family HTH domain